MEVMGGLCTADCPFPDLIGPWGCQEHGQKGVSCRVADLRRRVLKQKPLQDCLH